MCEMDNYYTPRNVVINETYDIVRDSYRNYNA